MKENKSKKEDCNPFLSLEYSLNECGIWLQAEFNRELAPKNQETFTQDAVAKTLIKIPKELAVIMANNKELLDYFKNAHMFHHKLLIDTYSRDPSFFPDRKRILFPILNKTPESNVAKR